MKTSPFLRIVSLAVVAALLAGCSAESRKAAWLERADGYYRAAEYEKARIEYQNVLQKDPENSPALERMALIWIEHGAPLRALPYLLQLRNRAPGNLEMRVKLGQIMLSLGKPADARREALAVLERSASFPDAIVLLTEAVRNEEEYKEAEQALRNIDRNRVSFHIASANLMLLRGNMSSARSALERGIALDPKSPVTHSAMARFHELQHNAEQAGLELKAAAELSPIRSSARVKYAGFLAGTGAVAEANEYLIDLTRKAPDYLPAWRGLAEIALAEKKHDEALAGLQSLLRQNPSDYEGQILRTRVWLAQGDVRRAIEDLQRIGKDFPGFGLASYQLALAYVRNNEEEKAVTAFQEAIAQNRDNVEAVLMLAVLNLRAGASQSAATAMVELVARRPDVIQAYPLLIQALQSLGRLDAAAQAIRKVLTASPQNAQMQYLLGLISIHLKQPADARQCFEKALVESPDLVPAMTELVNLDLKEGKHDDALRRARALIAKAPDVAMARVLEARAHAAQGRWDNVEASALKAMELGGVHPSVYALLAQSFVARKGSPELEMRLTDFLTRRPNDELAVVLGGQVYLQLNQFTMTRDIYEKHLAANPASSLVLNNLASLYDEQLPLPERALELARKARSLEPGSPVIADTLGWILFKRKEYPEAWTLLQESVGKLPHHPEVQFHFGMAATMNGKKEAALAAFRMAAGARADFAGKDEAKRQLALLEQP